MPKCHNNGCSKREYKEEENTETSCSHHPGGPIFHDALKGWSCCKKRCCDFDDFMNIVGCTLGKHNPMPQAERNQAKNQEPENPPDVVKSSEKSSEKSSDNISSSITKKNNNSSNTLPSDETAVADVAHQEAEKEIAARNALKGAYGQQTLVKGAPLEHELEAFNLERPDKNSCLKSMPVKTLPSLGRTLAKAQAKIEEARKQVSLGDKAVIKTGTTCFRAGCCAVYPNYHTCKHHPGHPVFHEGMKYWSCCNRKTSSFENFLKQEGCTTKADHKWAGLAGAKILDVRHDFHQQGDHVCVNIYAKNVMIESLKVNVNPVFLHVEAEYEAGLANLEFSAELFGVVDLDHKQTKVTVGAAKIEIQFKKKQIMRWTDLQYAGTDIEFVTASLEKEEEEEGEKIDTNDQNDGNASSDLDDYCSKAEPKNTMEWNDDEIDEFL